MKVNRSQYLVSTGEMELTASLAGKLQYRNQIPIIGDYVSLEQIDDKKAVIHDIKERKSYLSRPNGSGHADQFVKNYVEQAMAANLDYLFILSSLNDDFSINRIVRFIAASLRGGCKPVVILTKADLCENKEDYLKQAHDINSELDVIAVSSFTGEGFEDVRKYMKPGITIGLMGSSGVGKSSFINYLAGHEVMKVSSIREKDSKGRHTTTCREMQKIEETYFIDTPGMREFGIFDAESGVDQTFEDIRELIGHCRFGNCRHTSEPGCAVNAALADGRLSEERWRLYRSMISESRRTKGMFVPNKSAVGKGPKK